MHPLPDRGWAIDKSCSTIRLLQLWCNELKAIQEVRDIMVRKVITAHAMSSLTDIAKLMRKNRIGSVIITSGKKPIGVLTESDFIKLVARGCDMKTALAKDYMNRKVITCASSITVIDALMIMRNERIRHLPVVKNEDLVGIISIRDLIAATQFSSFYVI
jgi:CBS domain-containing protein